MFVIDTRNPGCEIWEGKFLSKGYGVSVDEIEEMRQCCYIMKSTIFTMATAVDFGESVWV